MRVAGLAGWMYLALGSCLLAQDETVVPDQHLETYFGAKPERFLTDPQGLLAPKERKERESFLSYHAEDSTIDFHLLLFGRGQAIPDGVRVEELGERFFGEGKPSLLALYFLGEPQRARILLSPQIADVINPAELGRVRGQAVRAAEAKTVAHEQLEEFCIQLAIGIFWIEKEAGLGDGPVSAEPGGSDSVPPPESVGGSATIDRLKAWNEEWGLPAAVIGGGMLAALLIRWVLLKRARHRFPDLPAPPRLGGGHGAGIGSLIDFRSSTRSPSRQKGGPEDSLGGL